MSKYEVRNNRCKCHPETCGCDPCVILRDASEYVTIYNKHTAMEICRNLNNCDEMADLLYKFWAAKIDDSVLIDYVQGKLEDI